MVDDYVDVPLVLPFVFIFSLANHQEGQLARRLKHVLVVLVLWDLLSRRDDALTRSTLLLKCYLTVAFFDF